MMIKKGIKTIGREFKMVKRKAKKLAGKSSKLGSKLDSGLQNYFAQDRAKAQSCLKELKC